MTPTEVPSSRLVSLDAFRGATIAGMILVNNPGNWATTYPQLLHSRWNGWTFTDMIFPFFLWIVGVAIHFAFSKRLQQGAGKGRLMMHAVRRSLIIFGLGLFIYGFPFGLLGDSFSLATWRIPGVLQRISVCYLVASAVYLWGGPKWEVILTLILFAVYWIATMVVPVPGYGAGILQPTGSMAWYIDSHLFAGHTWVGAPAPGFDPEGLLSTLPAIGTTLMGVLTGRWLHQANRSKEEKTAWMFVIGNFMLLAGVVLDMWMPINKNLWTPSYAVLMCGWALICLAVFYWLIDVKGYKAWAKPFVVFGVNAIAVYVLSELVAVLLGVIRVPAGESSVALQEWLFSRVFLPVASPINASLLFAIVFDLIMFAFVAVLWQRKIIIKA